MRIGTVRRRASHERSASGMRRELSGSLQLGIGVDHADAADAKRIGKIATGRETITGAQYALRGLLPDALGKPTVDRFFRAFIECNGGRGRGPCEYTSTSFSCIPR